jgi:hypothetical protein
LTAENKTGTLSRLNRRLNVMIAALGTLPFLATLWLLVVVGAAVLEESGAKIAAALKGVSAQPPLPGRPPTRIRPRWRSQRLMRARLRWRDAA